MNETPGQLAKRAEAFSDPDPLTTSELSHARRVANRWKRRAETMREMIDLIDLDRTTLDAPEDEHIAYLCERYGYGAVMDAAARLWARKDPRGAFTVGPCRALVEGALARWDESG